MSKTQENLAAAFAGESQANRKYLAFAAQADKENLPEVAKLFRAVAEAETVHAHSHLRIMGGVGDTKSNLQAALSGEEFEFKQMYPEMIAEAQRAGEHKAERTFMFANDVEKIHADLYKNALEQMGELSDEDYHVCTVCGYTVQGAAPDKCPVCNAGAKAFNKVD